MDNDGFVPITAIFYAVFHPTEGTKIVHQTPENSVSSGDLFDFDTVKNYIIPKPQLCNKLVLVKINRYRVLGYPVNIEGQNYLRNSFSFNFGFVFPYNSDTTPYEPAILRMGKMFRALEEQLLLLSRLDRDCVFFSSDFDLRAAGPAPQAPGQQKIRRVALNLIDLLIVQVFQDLNNYLECCIPIDTANSIDIKLFPMLPPPVNIKAFQVPLLTVKLHLLMDVNWDPTMVKICPYIDGLNLVKRISELADADYLLTKQCIQHLMHYKCITMVDVFQFLGIYAPTSTVGDFLTLATLAEECQAYVVTPVISEDPLTPGPPPSTSPSAHLPGPLARLSHPVRVPSKASLFYLYRSLNQGQCLREWYVQHHKLLAGIDIRRFINFGVVKGLIYRVHLYPVLGLLKSGLSENVDDVLRSYEQRRLPKAAISERRVSFADPIQSDDDSDDSDVSDYFNYKDEPVSVNSDISEDNDENSEDVHNLVRLLRGFQHFDSICTELHKPRRDVEHLLEQLGGFSEINA